MSVREPRNVDELSCAVREYALAHDLPEQRVRERVAYMALAGRLADAAGDTPPVFTFRGELILELRTDGHARPSEDFDATYSGCERDLVRALDDAISAPYGRFTFGRTGDVTRMESVRTIRTELAVCFDDAPWVTIQVDVTPPETHLLELERVPAFDIRKHFGVRGPAHVPALSARYHLAQKLHGMTARRDDGRPNERVKDAVDALILCSLVHELARVREACTDVFARSDRSEWPPAFDPPPEWEAPYAEMARDVGLGERTLGEAVERLRALIAAIDAA